MIGPTSTTDRAPRRRRPSLDVVGLMALALAPYLLRPGKLTSDTKLYLHTNPLEFLARVVFMWDRQVAAGTVSHQHVGYLFPMGPFFAVGELLGLPDWVTQRLWWASIAFVAGLGARWLALRLGASRLGALVAAVVYMFAPYQITFTARLSVLLLPFAVLPWMIGHTLRGLERLPRERGAWREPAWIALLAMGAGSVNLSALLLVAIGPAIAVAWRAFDVGWRRVARFVGKVAALTFATSAWWLNGLRIQGRYGLPVLGLTENVQTVAEYSLPTDIVRGFGNWLTYGREPDGRYSLAQTEAWTSNRVVVFATFALAALAIAGALVLRWRTRALFAAMIVVGTVIGAGAWPIDDPRIAGRAWRGLTDFSAVFAALRNTPRVVPVIVLGVAVTLAAVVTALRTRSATFERVAATLVVALAVVGFAPVWEHGATSEPFERAATPDYWNDLATSLERSGHETRVFEIPGTSFAVFRWGNAIDPLLPGLTDRPYLSREVLPYGTAGTVDLLDAFERRLQLGTFEPESLVPIAKLFGAGTIVVRNDLDYGRTVSPHPALVWGRLSDGPVGGLSDPVVFGDPIVESLRLDPIALGRNADATVLPAATFDLTDPPSLLDAASPRGAVVVVGDGDGVVDAAASQLISGDELIAELGALDDGQLGEFLAADARVVITDSNRKRYRNFFSSIAATVGPTELADETNQDPYGYETRPDVFAHDDPSDRPYVVQSGGRASATRDGGSGRPEDRAAMAFDGNAATSWRIDGASVVGERIRVELDEPQSIDEVRLLQALDFPRDRSITEVAITVDGSEPTVHALDHRSFRGRGQPIALGVEAIRELEIEIVSTSDSPVDPRFANPVGFAEVSIGRAQISETLVVPDVFDRRDIAVEQPIDVVLTRQRVDGALLGRRDEEPQIARTFTLPSAQQFEVTGSLRIATNAPDGVLDASLGSGITGGRTRASSHLQGSVAARSASAFDADPTTRWTSAFRPQVGEWIEVELERAIDVDSLVLSVVADGRHQVPTRVAIRLDGERVGSFPLPAVDDGAGTVELPIDIARTVGVSRVRVTIEAVRPASSSPDPWLPVALEVDGLDVVASTPIDRSGCRDDLITIDDEPIAIRELPHAAFEMCGPPIALDAGQHSVVSAPGAQTGFDIDRVVMRSTERVRSIPQLGPTIEVTDSGRDSLRASATTDGDPFWLVLRESSSEGWQVSGSGFDVGPATMIDGYANGWLVTPHAAGPLRIELQWQPQRSQWIAFALSVLALLACCALIARGRRLSPPRSDAESHPGLLVSRLRTERFGGVRFWSAVVLVGVGTAIVGRAWVAVIVVATTSCWRSVPARIAAVVAAPTLVVLARAIDQPDLVWVPLAWLAFDLIARSDAGAPDSSDPPAFADPVADSPL